MNPWLKVYFYFFLGLVLLGAGVFGRFSYFPSVEDKDVGLYELLYLVLADVSMVIGLLIVVLIMTLRIGVTYYRDIKPKHFS